MVYHGMSHELQGADNVQGQISEYVLKSNGGHCVYYPSSIFRNTKIGEYHSDTPQVYLGHIQSRDAFRPIMCGRKYLMDYKA
jgi:hypothetical protein